MTTDPLAEPWGGATYHGFSTPPLAAPKPRSAPAPARRVWPIPRGVTIGAGVAAAVALGLLFGFWARPNLAHPAPAGPMRAVTPAGYDAAQRMNTEVNAPPPAPVPKSAGKLEVLPPDLARNAPRPVATLPASVFPSSPGLGRAPIEVDPAVAPQIAAAQPCAAARSRAAQIVCADPELAAADRDLNSAYRRALRSGVPPEQLRADQRDWLAIREDAARRSPRAVADVYEQRIDELNQIADDGPG